MAQDICLSVGVSHSATFSPVLAAVKMMTTSLRHFRGISQGLPARPGAAADLLRDILRVTAPNYLHNDAWQHVLPCHSHQGLAIQHATAAEQVTAEGLVPRQACRPSSNSMPLPADLRQYSQQPSVRSDNLVVYHGPLTKPVASLKAGLPPYCLPQASAPC
jgi:hypothetical protein